MLVDLRVATTIGVISPRSVHVTLPSDCSATLIDPGVERHRYLAGQVVHGRADTVVTVTLEGGQGALVKVSGQSCVQKMLGARSWWFDPAAISLSHAYPSEPSPKASTYGSYGASIRYKSPGGLAGDESNYIIGGIWTKDLDSDFATKAIADAGFLVATVPATASSLPNTLGWAASYGIFIMRLTGIDMSPSDVASTAMAYGCHTNWFGMALNGTLQKANCASSIQNAVSQGKSLRSSAYWQIPVLLGVTDIDCALDAAGKGLPLTPIRINLKAPQGSAASVASTVLSTFRDLQLRSAGRPMTASIMLGACDTNSDSLLRFAAYSSLVVAGSQSLWWEDMDACAQVGSAKFALIGGINARVGQWGNAFLSGPGGVANVAPTRVFSTSSLAMGNTSRPGGDSTDLVQAMSPEMLVFELFGTPVTVPGGKKSTHLLFVVSTEVSVEAGGAIPRNVTLTLRKDIRGTQPIEGNCFEGHCVCNMMRIGNVLPLILSGGSAQLVGYFLVDEQ